MAEQLASDAEISALVETLQATNEDDLSPVDKMLGRYPEDPRLHFMRGSILAGRTRPIDAHAAMVRAVEIAPAYRIARYQLGFFELTSGEPERALSTWGPLLAGPANDYLRVFVEGMTHLIRDEFRQAIACFERGMTLNTENVPLNGDIQLLMTEVRKLAEQAAGNGQSDGDQTSATSLLLGQFGGNRTLN